MSTISLAVLFVCLCTERSCLASDPNSGERLEDVVFARQPALSATTVLITRKLASPERLAQVTAEALKAGMTQPAKALIFTVACFDPAKGMVQAGEFAEQQDAGWGPDTKLMVLDTTLVQGSVFVLCRQMGGVGVYRFAGGKLVWFATLPGIRESDVEPKRYAAGQFVGNGLNSLSVHLYNTAAKNWPVTEFAVNDIGVAPSRELPLGHMESK